MVENSPFKLPKSHHTGMTKNSVKIGDRGTSDVVVRIRTKEGRDSWFYCHTDILVGKCKYFAERLSEDWPTCQILDSRSCVEIYCQEIEFNSHVTVLRLLYVGEPLSWFGVRNTIGVLQVAVHLGCPQMARACMDYLEAAPWEETEEEEILRVIPCLGPQYESILARLNPVDITSVVRIFISTFRFATSCPHASMRELKMTAQEQLEFMLTDDDDVPLLELNNIVVKSEVKTCTSNLLSRLTDLINVPSSSDIMPMKIQELLSLLSDISWICQILSRMHMMKDVVHYWLEVSSNIVKTIETVSADADALDVNIKVVIVTAKVLEAVGYGHVIVSTSKRLQAIYVWLPFIQRTRPLIDSLNTVDASKVDNETWQALETALVSMILTLPSSDQAEILAGWLGGERIRYPDLTVAFEIWCYRSKIAKRRFP